MLSVCVEHLPGNHLKQCRNDGAAHPFLSNIRDVRVYNDGTARVDATVENVRDVAIANGLVAGSCHPAKRRGTRTETGHTSRPAERSLQPRMST
ncbi:MAG: hypothetical protein LBB84_03700 [Tannerellaceae bacterium]|jgi:hypothetical protein|nr:hypothetical protein [Tannerellaceae bacterium]